MVAVLVRAGPAISAAQILGSTNKPAIERMVGRCNRGSETVAVTGLVAAGAVSCTRDFLRVAVIKRMVAFLVAGVSMGTPPCGASLEVSLRTGTLA